MKNFPVLHSLLAPEALGHFIVEQYQLPPETSCRLIRSGLNDTYLLSTPKQRWVFRLYTFQWRSTEEIKAECDFLLQLQAAGVQVSYPLPDRAGNLLQAIPMAEGVRTGVLFSYAKGKKRARYDLALHQKAGEAMARLHQVGEKLTLSRPHYQVPTMMADGLGHIHRFLDPDEEAMKRMKRMQGEFLSRWEKLNQSGFRRGVVHLDIWPDNIHVDDKGELTLFDFDFCGHGFLTLDLAYYHLQLHQLERDQAQKAAYWQGFLEAYEAIIPLSPMEKNIIPALALPLYYFYLGVQCQRFEDWSSVFLSPEYIRQYIDLRIETYFKAYEL